MVVRAGNLRRIALVAIALASCAGAATVQASSAFAEEQTESFTEANTCKNWTVPAGVTSIGIAAFGGVGESSATAAGGDGDKVTANVTVTPKEVLDVCVGYVGEVFGQGGAPSRSVSTPGGDGGGASGIARGKDFLHVLVIAGGGGGGGGTSIEEFDGEKIQISGGAGGDANEAGHNTSLAIGGQRRDGFDANEYGPGPGENGKDGEESSFEGFTVWPGGGGAGGSGFEGGGGGQGGAGGAGGTDYCEEKEGVSGCSTESGEGEGSGEVKISYEPVSCTTAVGLAKYAYPGTGRLQLRNNLSTNLAAKQTLVTSIENGAQKFHLTKLEAASCTGAAGARNFSGEGKASKGTEGGWTVSFSVYEGTGGYFFKATFTKGASTVFEGGPLTKVSPRQTVIETIQ
jgi:hypothetical protein